MIKHALFAAALLVAVPAAQAQHKHVHGEGRLDAALDRDTITLSLELPLDATVGFERAPKNDKEKAALAATEKALNDAAALWRPTPAAGCAVQSVEVGMPKFDGGGHADIDANYVFRCANPAALKGVETTLFKQFRRLYRIETQRVGPAGQGAQRLTPKQPVLGW
jgi:hypothetical protein